MKGLANVGIIMAIISRFVLTNGLATVSRKLFSSRIRYDANRRSSWAIRSEASNDNNNNNMKFPPYVSVIAPLLFVYISNQWSRSSIYYLVNFSEDASPLKAMNIDIGFSEADYGILASIGFTILYATASLFAGTLADRYDRKLITVLSCLTWSAATLVTAFATSYSMIFSARVLMGLACAFTTPAAYTLIRDLFPEKQAGLASSAYGSGVYIGGALSSLTLLLDQELGWRKAVNLVSIFGITGAITSGCILPKDSVINSETMKEKQEENDMASNDLLSGVKEVFDSSTIQFLFLAVFLRFSSGLAIGVWSAPYFRLAFPEYTSQYAVTNAFIVGLCGVTSNIVGGYLADIFAQKAASDYQLPQNAGRMLIPVVSSFCAIPAWYMCVHESSFELAMIWLAIEYLIAECWFGPVIAVLQSSVSSSRGGIAQGLFTLTGALANISPSLLGFIYEQQQTNNSLLHNESAILSNLLATIVCAGYLTSSIAFGLSLNSQIQNQNILKK